jgi:exopolysaccharide biosynthesis polyprenyl glycosylphosphotransferase
MVIRLRQIIILVGDIALLYAALMLTLVIRYSADRFATVWPNHRLPFSLIFVVWLAVLYLNDMYKWRSLTFTPATVQRFLLSITIGLGISMVLFYLFGPFFQLTPKTNLVIFSAVFGILDFAWRISARMVFGSRGLQNRVLIIGVSPAVNELKSHLLENKHIGYRIQEHLPAPPQSQVSKELAQTIAANKIDTIVLQSHFKKDPVFTQALYRLLPLNIAIVDMVTFYEAVFQKIPLNELDERWFIENVLLHRRFYDVVKRLFDVTMGVVAGVVLFVPSLIIALVIKIFSPGPTIYKQQRMGKNEAPFVLYKFRTMRADGVGELWTNPKDNRLTSVGRVLRFTHLDEVPQLINIIKGDISLVGPRPERVELAAHYQQLPYYEIRHIIKPGLTGWAQVNYRPSASLEEAHEKLQYDMFYIKNRSLALDLLVVLKTVKMFLFSHY